jgi:hypothetical protein
MVLCLEREARVGGCFHGIDWDLGEMIALKAWAVFLLWNAWVGEIGRMAKRDGFFVSLAPLYSASRVHGTFQSFMNLTDEHRPLVAWFCCWDPTSTRCLPYISCSFFSSMASLERRRLYIRDTARSTF